MTKSAQMSVPSTDRSLSVHKQLSDIVLTNDQTKARTILIAIR